MRKEVLKILTGQDEVNENARPEKSAQSGGWLDRASNFLSAAQTAATSMAETAGIVSKDSGGTAVEQAANIVRESKSDRLSPEIQRGVVSAFLDKNAQNPRSSAYAQFGHLLYHLRLANNNNANVTTQELTDAFQMLKFADNFTDAHFLSVISSPEPEKMARDINTKTAREQVDAEPQGLEESSEESIFGSRDSSFDDVDTQEMVVSPLEALGEAVLQKKSNEKPRNDQTVLENLSELENQIRSGQIVVSKAELKKITQQVGEIRKQINAGKSPVKLFDAVAGVRASIEKKVGDYQEKEQGLKQRYGELFEVRGREINQRMQDINFSLGAQDFENELQLLVDDVDKLREDFSNLKQDYEVFYQKKAVGSEGGRFSKMDKAIAKFDAELKKIPRQRALLQEQENHQVRKELNTRYTELSDRASALNVELQAINFDEDLAGSARKLEELERQVNSLKEEYDSLKEEVRTVIGKEAVSGGKIERMDKKVKFLEAKVSDFRSQVQSLSEVKSNEELRRSSDDPGPLPPIESDDESSEDLDNNSKSYKDEYESTVRESSGLVDQPERKEKVEKRASTQEELRRSSGDPGPLPPIESDDESSEDLDSNAGFYTEEKAERISLGKKAAEYLRSIEFVGGYDQAKLQKLKSASNSPSEENVKKVSTKWKRVAGLKIQRIEDRLKEDRINSIAFNQELERLRSMVDKGNASEEFNQRLNNVEQAFALYVVVKKTIETDLGLGDRENLLKQEFLEIASVRYDASDTALQELRSRLESFQQKLLGSLEVNDETGQTLAQIQALNSAFPSLNLLNSAQRELVKNVEKASSVFEITLDLEEFLELPQVMAQNISISRATAELSNMKKDLNKLQFKTRGSLSAKVAEVEEKLAGKAQLETSVAIEIANLKRELKDALEKSPKKTFKGTVRALLAGSSEQTKRMEVEKKPTSQRPRLAQAFQKVLSKKEADKKNSSTPTRPRSGSKGGAD